MGAACDTRGGSFEPDFEQRSSTGQHFVTFLLLVYMHIYILVGII
jgi:hypothetical protein